MRGKDSDDGEMGRERREGERDFDDPWEERKNRKQNKTKIIGLWVEGCTSRIVCSPALLAIGCESIFNGTDGAGNGGWRAGRLWVLGTAPEESDMLLKNHPLSSSRSTPRSLFPSVVSRMQRP